ncbi:hypothetical protein GOBAR_DD32775 [Gossypium barbadense]|nr:hypothetical protein GOBAR_DD32775 [Gossypium barbadense]
MDDLFSSEDDDHLFDLDYNPYARKRPLSSRLDRDDYDETDEEEANRQKLYLVPYRWWKEAQRSVADEIVGILYNVLSNYDNADSEIVLDLRKEESSGTRVKMDEGVSSREYALVKEALWLRTLKWHNDSKTSEEDDRYHCVAEGQSQEVFPLQIRLSFSPGTNSLLVKISLKDNAVDFYRRACSIFNSQSELLQIWDFSGQTSQFVMNEIINLPKFSPGKQGKEVLLELHVHGFFVFTNKTDERLAEPMKTENSFGKSRVRMNMNSDNLSSQLMLTNTSLSGSGYRGIGVLGFAGLQNLGNTCFMNSAVQCLVHTTQLGELSLAFGELLRKLWAPGAMPVAPRMFKFKLAKFAPQFDGYNQHDSQEFLAFLLDGLHEDLNCVKCKPYIEAKDAEGRPDEEVADEHWLNHLARNASIIVDIFQGQYRSTLVCPVCKKVSVTFDPFMYLTLPLPSTTMRTMTLTVFSTDGIMLPMPFTITVPKGGRLKDLIDSLSLACSLKDDETLLVAEVCIEDVVNDYDGDETRNTVNENSKVEGIVSPLVSYCDAGPDSGEENDVHLNADFKFYLVDKPGSSEIKMNDPVPISSLTKNLDVTVHWSDKMIEKYDTCLLSSLPEVFKPLLFAKRHEESISLYKCLEGFLQEEPLGPDDMWYCPRCKKHQQAIKKLDLWRLPEILVIHLKRFSYSRFFKNKLETYVDFPIHDLNLSNYISHIDNQLSNCYQLYAVTNHYGRMGGGHYTAFIDHGHGRWYEFDDDRVFPISEDRIKSSAAYVLFYRRVREM